MLVQTAGQIRVPLHLDGHPFAQALHRHTFQSREFPFSPEKMAHLYQQFFSSAREGRWPDLYLASLRAHFPDGDRKVSVDLRNPQFGAADTGSAEFECGYEPEIGSLIDLLLPEDGVLADVGANWGYFPVYTSTRSDFRGKVHAFEPHPMNYADLQNVVAGFRLKDSVVCHDVALSNREGECFLSVPENIFSGQAHVSEKGISARMQTLDGLNLPRLDFLKLDVEGFEPIVVEGAAATLTRHKPAVVFEDWSGANGHYRTFQLLHELGYLFFWPCWQSANGSLSQKPTGRSCGDRLTLFQFSDRGQLPQQVNILALPRARFTGEFREALLGNRP